LPNTIGDAQCWLGSKVEIVQAKAEFLVFLFLKFASEFFAFWKFTLTIISRSSNAQSKEPGSSGNAAEKEAEAQKAVVGAKDVRNVNVNIT
jgi:hypothetical protein